MNTKEYKFQVDEINKIKYKLNKYAELKNDAKVKEYIDHLKLFKVNLEILKETEIVPCLKVLRAKQNSAYSSQAGDLIAAWKAKCNSDDSNKPSAKPVNGVVKKADPVKAPMNGMNGKSNDSAKSSKTVNEVPVKNGHVAKPDPTLNGKKRSISDLHHSELVKTNGKPDSSKPAKAPSSSDKSRDKQADEMASKRQKLTYSDYKSLKTTEPRDEPSYRSSYAIDENFELGDNIEDDVNSSAFLNDLPKKAPPAKKLEKPDRYSPQPLNSDASSRNDDSNKLMKAPPMPLAPLSSILPSMPTSTTSQFSASLAANSRSTVGPASSMENDEDFIDRVFKNRNSKKVLYFGRKKGGDGTFAVPKLYDLCVQTLTQSLDDLPNRLYLFNLNSDFPIAFDLIKPVLEKANAKQLENIESYSPNLMEDSDPLWKRLCETEFKKPNPPEEDETWRELYFKKQDEREEEFKRVREIISSKQAGKPKERTTQLASMKTHTIKTVSNFSSGGSLRSSNSSNISKMGGASAMRPLGVPTRVIDARRRPGFGAAPPPQKSQGMKDTLKLLKKCRR